jgi:hypothetical protein
LQSIVAVAVAVAAPAAAIVAGCSAPVGQNPARSFVAMAVDQSSTAVVARRATQCPLLVQHCHTHLEFPEFATFAYYGGTSQQFRQSQRDRVAPN